MTDVGIKQRTGVVLLTLASGQFLMTLDSSVMNVAIATVAKDVGPAGDRRNPAVPPEVSARAHRDCGRILFISDTDLRTALTDAGVGEEVAQAVLDENEQARLDGLRIALAVLAIIAQVGLFFSCLALPGSPRISRDRRFSAPRRHRGPRARRSTGSHGAQHGDDC